MGNLAGLYQAILTSRVEVPYPVRVRAARWYARRRDAAANDLRGALTSVLTPADTIDLLPLLAECGSRVPQWAVTAVLSRADLPGPMARRLLVDEPRRTVRRQVAEASTSPAVLELLARDADPLTLINLAWNEHATVEQRTGAVLSLDRLLAAMSDPARLAIIDRHLVRPALNLPTGVYVDLAAAVQSPQVAALLCQSALPEEAALTLTVNYVSVELASATGHDDLRRALDAAGCLARHPSQRVRDTLADAVDEYAARFTTEGLPALLWQLRGSGVDQTLQAASLMLSDDRPVASLGTLAGLDEDGWAVFERLADTFTGSLDDLAAIAADVVR